MNQFKTILKFEFASYVKSKPFMAVTVIFILIALVGPCIPTFVSMSQNGSQPNTATAATKTAAIVDTTAGKIYTQDEVQKYLPGYTVKYLDNVDDAAASVKSGESQMAVSFGGDGGDYSYTLYMASMSISNMSIQGTIDALVKNIYLIDALGATQAQIDASDSFTPVSSIVNVTASSGGAMSSNFTGNVVFAYILVYILFIVLVLYGQYIVMSVIREKSSKAMELLITTAKPINLIFGKVVGVCLAGLTQLACFAVVGVASLKINLMFMNSNSGIGQAVSSLVSTVNSVMNIPPMLIVYLFVFFLLGFFTYAFLYAAFASTASRMEDANSIAMLPMLLLIVSFFLSIFGLTNSQSTGIVVCSFIPFFSPMVMYMRLCLGTAPNWQALISIVISLVTIVGIAFASAKIYRMGVLMYGRPPKMGDLLKMFVTPDSTKASKK